MSADAGRVGWREVLQPEWLPALAVMLAGILLHSMNVMLVATVLPSIVADIGGAHLIAWAMTAFMAASIVAATSSGLINRAVGPRGGYLIGAAIFALGSLACAMAPSMIDVIMGRIVQGFGGGMVAATAYVLVRKTFPQRLWPRVFAMLASVWSISVLIGPLLGGVFANLGHWRGAFLTVAGISAALACLTFFALPRLAAGEMDCPRLPALRLLLLVLAIAAMSFASVFEAPPAKGAMIALAGAAFVLMLRRDRRAADPLLPSDAFSLATVTGTGLWIALLVSVVFTQMPSFVPLFIQRIHGADPLTAGYFVASASLCWTTAAIVVSGLSGRWPLRLIRIGPVIMLVGLCALALAMPRGPLLLVLPAIMLMGLGMGTCWAFIAQTVMANARPGEEDIAASSVPTVQQTGLALGAAWAGLVANAAGLADGDTLAATARAAFWVPVAAVPMILGAALMGWRLKSLAAE
ncbi:MAG: hypothetical protein TEF_12505 [Rhizobiales bacterium NRL2]|nr:MAG: hypothetical protein TEF_12505 [Rhizobiales bacterium NRL2]